MKHGKILVTLTLVAAANSFATGFGTSNATFSPDGSKVAYRPGCGAHVAVPGAEEIEEGLARALELRCDLCGKAVDVAGLKPRSPEVHSPAGVASGSPTTSCQLP